MATQRQWRQKQNWVHFIGIGGITTGQLAAAFADQGWTVTGSDNGIYEPMKSFLEQRPELQVNPEYDYGHLIWQHYTSDSADSELIPERVIALGGLSRKNREILFAKKRGIKVENYAEVLQADLVVAGSSLVVAGSFGKSTTTAMLRDILLKSRDPNLAYMVGAITADETSAITLRTAQSRYSLIEGDEYLADRESMRSKFHYYSPDYLLLTGYAHDHTDMFPTEAQYRDNFQQLICNMPKTGAIVFNADATELTELVKPAPCKIVPYSSGDTEWRFNLKILGKYNYTNAIGAATMAKQLGISNGKIETTLNEFAGLARRLELKGKKTLYGKTLTIIDDFGATAAKASASIRALKEEFQQSKLLVFFEPNIGSRTRQALVEFRTTFAAVDTLYLPEFSEVNQQGIISSTEFRNYLESQSKIAAIMPLITPDDLVNQVDSELENSDRDVVIAFLSSSGVDRWISALL